MREHIHLSVISVVTIVSVVMLTTFLLHMAALRFSASENENTQLWGRAFAGGWG